jgi:hypothetical protein
MDARKVAQSAGRIARDALVEHDWYRHWVLCRVGLGSAIFEIRRRKRQCLLDVLGL